MVTNISRVFFSESLEPIQMIIVVWNKSFVAVEVKLAVWIDDRRGILLSPLE